MPFKHNNSRRHHIPKARRRVTNWPAYEAGLQQRGDLTFWLDETALSGWQAPRRTSRGGQPIYADMAIEVVLILRLAFHLALRQGEGFTRSVLRLLGLQVAVSDHSTLSRRGRGFAGRQPRAARHDRPVHVMLDSTGLQIFGQGDWDAEKHGRKPRQWRSSSIITPSGYSVACRAVGSTTTCAPQWTRLAAAKSGASISVFRR